MKRKLIGLFLVSATCAVAQTGTMEGDLGDMLKGLTAGMTETGKVALVEARSLQKVMPPALSSLRRVRSTAGTESVLAAQISRARAQYEGPGGARITAEITDWGNGAKTAWARMGLEARRMTTGSGLIDRISHLEGWPGSERYQATTRKGDIHVRVADRFILHLSGEHIEWDVLRGTLQHFDLKQLASLKP